MKKTISIPAYFIVCPDQRFLMNFLHSSIGECEETGIIVTDPAEAIENCKRNPDSKLSKWLMSKQRTRGMRDKLSPELEMSALIDYLSRIINIYTRFVFVFGVPNTEMHACFINGHFNDSRLLYFLGKTTDATKEMEAAVEILDKERCNIRRFLPGISAEERWKLIRQSCTALEKLPKRPCGFMPADGRDVRHISNVDLLARNLAGCGQRVILTQTATSHLAG